MNYLTVRTTKQDQSFEILLERTEATVKQQMEDGEEFVPFDKV